jgi:hypothetical protein
MFNRETPTMLKMFLAAAVAAVLSTTVLAHSSKGRNGGPQVDAGNHHVEILPKGRELTVFVTDGDDKSVATAGFKGTAVFVVGGKAQRITLTPAGGNTLKGEAAVDLPAEPKGAVQITTSGGGAIQAKF